MWSREFFDNYLGAGNVDEGAGSDGDNECIDGAARDPIDEHAQAHPERPDNAEARQVPVLYVVSNVYMSIDDRLRDGNDG